MKLNDIRDNAGARKGRVRVGRGIGSGVGKTSGRGQKGQTSRSGVSIFGFEGGQMPLHMRLPKRGFNKPNRREYSEVNIGALQRAVDAGRLDAKAVVDLAALQTAGLRLLGKGELKAKLDIHVAGVTKSAQAAVEAVGGKVTLPAVKAAAEA